MWKSPEIKPKEDIECLVALNEEGEDITGVKYVIAKLNHWREYGLLWEAPGGLVPTHWIEKWMYIPE